MLRLLVLSNNPKRPSFRQRIEIYLDDLRKHGIDCTTAKLPKGSWARRRLFQQASSYDAVFLHKKRLNGWDAFWLGRYSRCIIYDFDDAIMYDPDRPERPSSRREKLFSRTVRLSDAVIAGNEYLAEHALNYNKRVEVIPTGLNVVDYKLPSDSENRDIIRLVWIGSSSTLAYLQTIVEPLREICSRYPHVRVRVISDRFCDDPGIAFENIPWSLEGQTQALANGDIGIAPLPDDPMTRGKCGFKILQYQSTSLPTVASGVGVNWQIVRDGIDGFIADTPEEWVEKLSFLIENIDQARKMGRSALLNVKEKYDTSVIAPQLCRLITSTIQSSRPTHG